jgi:uncharacterized membrane protein (Fun14 family)
VLPRGGAFMNRPSRERLIHCQTMIFSLVTAALAQAQKASPPPASSTPAQNAGSSVFDSLAPYLGQISFGGLAGFATGYALKKVGRVALVVFGLLFIAVQILAYYGVVQIDWLRIQSYADPLLKRESLEGSFNALLRVLTNNVPFAGAFIPGFILGLRFG